jgi:aspartyl-tRNA synthetase
MPETETKQEYDRDELRDDREIDPRQLDVEFMRNGDIFTKWAERLVDAKAHEEFCEFQLEKVQSSLTIRAADNPDEFGISKPTVDAIKAAVKLHPDFDVAARNYRKARKTVALLDVAVKALSIRKASLENLVTLHGMQYFAGPEVPRDLVKKWEEHGSVGGNVNRLPKAREVQRKPKK